MSIKISEDQNVILNGEKAIKVWLVVGWAGGVRRNVDVVNLERGVIYGYGYREVFYGVVQRVEVVGGESLVQDRVVHQSEEATTTSRTWAVSADGAVIWKVREN